MPILSYHDELHHGEEPPVPKSATCKHFDQPAGAGSGSTDTNCVFWPPAPLYCVEGLKVISVGICGMFGRRGLPAGASSDWRECIIKR